MKIEGPGTTTGAKGAQKPKKTGESGFGALVRDAEVNTDATAPGALRPPAPVDALLSLQADEHSARALQEREEQERGESLLRHLDHLRLGLLSGRLPERTLRDLSQIIAQKKSGTLDPRLSDILDEIDLRARVELAKLGRD